MMFSRSCLFYHRINLFGVWYRQITVCKKLLSAKYSKRQVAEFIAMFVIFQSVGLIYILKFIVVKKFQNKLIELKYSSTKIPTCDT